MMLFIITIIIIIVFRFAELVTCYMINTVVMDNMTDNGTNISGAKYYDKTVLT